MFAIATEYRQKEERDHQRLEQLLNHQTRNTAALMSAIYNAAAHDANATSPDDFLPDELKSNLKEPMDEDALWDCLDKIFPN